MKQRQLNKDESGKRKAEIVSVSVLSNVVSLVQLSCSQIWNIEKEKDREKEKAGDRPAKLNKKRGDRQLEQEMKKDIFCWKNNMKIL